MAAAPHLVTLEIHFLAQRFEGNSNDPRPDDLAAPPLVPGPALATRVTSLKLLDIAIPHAVAAQNLANAFPDLIDLELYFFGDFPAPDIGCVLRLPRLRSLSYCWESSNYAADDVLQGLDLTHLPTLERLDCVLHCSASLSFKFNLPPSIKVINATNVPLPALLRLLSPRPGGRPALQRIKLDVPDGQGYARKAGETVVDVIARGIEQRYFVPPERIGYTPELLDELFRLAKQRGVEITGNVIHSHARNQSKAGSTRAERSQAHA